ASGKATLACWRSTESEPNGVERAVPTALARNRRRRVGHFRRHGRPSPEPPASGTPTRPRRGPGPSPRSHGHQGAPRTERGLGGGSPGVAHSCAEEADIRTPLLWRWALTPRGARAPARRRPSRARRRLRPPATEPEAGRPSDR